MVVSLICDGTGAIKCVDVMSVRSVSVHSRMSRKPIIDVLLPMSFFFFFNALKKKKKKVYNKKKPDLHP